jgi:protein MpaA
MRRALGTVLVVLAALLVVPPPAGADRTAGEERSAVVEKRLVGRSVKGRAIMAYRVGDPDTKVTAVAMATMHGDEPAVRHILRGIRDGRKVRGIDLWLIPTYNPDGLARHTRRNARGVDLNRNFPYRWADLDGSYESGPHPASEPETRAVMSFFDEIRPRYVVSFHQPLHGVDTSVPSVRRFALRLSRGLNLPRKRFVCGGVCHGTFTQWFNHRYSGRAVTVEYAARPGRHRMRHRAPRQLVRTLGGHY